MMKLILVLLILSGNYFTNSFTVENADLSDALYLNDNFFANLHKLNFDDKNFNDARKFIDRQIEHFGELIERTHGLDSSQKLKRSVHQNDLNVLSMDSGGVHVLNGFFEQPRVPVRNPLDIKLFYHDHGSTEVWYAVTLENLQNQNEETSVTLYRYEEENYKELFTFNVEKGKFVQTYTVHGVSYIFIAGHYGVQVYIFDLNEQFHEIEMLNILNPSSIENWEHENELYMVVAQEINKQTYDTNSTIFKWTGTTFQWVQYLKTYGARKITSFLIDHNRYLAAANSRNDAGETDIFSEIYKYNSATGKFISHQQLLTHGAVDIKYFCFQQYNVKESFLIVANSHGTDSDGTKNYRTDSIIYKFVEDYFMPFQSIHLRQIEQWSLVAGQSGEFLLLAVCKNIGIKVYQYDGWRFVESDVQYTGNAFGPGIRSIESYWYKNQQLIVVANENDYGDLHNLFVPSYDTQNQINEFQKDMYEWCQRTTNELDVDDVKELNLLVELAPKTTDPEITLNGRNTIANSVIYNLILLTDDDDYAYDDVKGNTVGLRVKKSSENLEQLEKQIDAKAKQLDHIYEELKSTREPIVFHGNVNVKNLEIDSDSIVFKELHTDTINTLGLEQFFNDIYFLNEPFAIDDSQMQFDHIVFDGFVYPKFVNRMPTDRLLYKTSNLKMPHTDLTVDGNILCSDVFVDGHLDHVKITEDTVLLVNGEQYLNGFVKFAAVDCTSNVNVHYVNNWKIESLGKSHVVDMSEHTIDTLTVKNISINYINGMNMQSLESLVLRVHGNQNIVGNYQFDTLIVDDDFEFRHLLSNVSSDAFTYTVGATNHLEQSLIFTETVHAERVHVIYRLNQIPVLNGKLDVLLKNHSIVQYVTGTKTFDTINLTGPILLRGKIRTKGIEPPFIKRNLTLVGDYVINGETIIDSRFKFHDLTESERKYSIERLNDHGLLLDEQTIPVHMNFKKGLTVDKIDVDNINNINVNSWMKFENDMPVITGRKIFKDNLRFNGKILIKSVNGYNLEHLHNNTLKLKGNQEITGTHNYFKLTTRRTVSDNTLLNGERWENVLTLNGEQFINGTTLVTKPLKVEKFEAKSAIIRGKLMNYNFDEIIADTLFNDSVKTVTGRKKFDDEKLVFHNLSIDRINEVNLSKLVHEVNVWLSDIVIRNLHDITKPLHVENLLFGHLNGVSQNDFGNIWLLKNHRHQVIYEDQYFRQAEFNENVAIESNQMNDVNIIELDENAIKINELNNELKTVTFENAITSHQSVTVLDGNINHINISEAVLTNGLQNQTIFGHKDLGKNLTVDGLLHVNSLLSGINLTALQHLTSMNNNEKNLNISIEGNIDFIKEFNVNHLNQYNIEKIAKNAWYKDKSANITGFILFDHVVFEDDLTVHGFVDDIELEWLWKNYFSKTKNQNVIGKLTVSDGITFDKDLTAEHAYVYGYVANISIQDFNERVLKNEDQTFKFPVTFDELEVTQSFDAGSVNNLNLATDVMRNDVTENIVTGFKAIDNIETVYLDLADGRKIQHVNLDYWFKNVVPINGSLVVNGLKTFKNAKFEHDIELSGHLNSMVFDEDHILTTHTKQQITGRKNFILNNSTLVFDILKMKSLLNGIDVDKMFQIQIDTSRKTIPIDAVKHFYNNIYANHIDIKHLYQSVDIPKLLKNITDLQKYVSYEDEYAGMISFANKMLTVLKHQPYFLEKFKQIQQIKMAVNYILPLEESDNISVAFIKISDRIATVSIYTWNDATEQFMFTKDIALTTRAAITYITSVYLYDKWHLYLEEESNKFNDFSHLAYLYELSDNLENPYLVKTLGTKSIISFILPDTGETCLLNLQLKETININCENVDKTFQTRTQLKYINGLKVTALTIQNNLYLFVINLRENSIHTSIDVHKYNTNSSEFVLKQVLDINNPQGLDTIKYKRNYFLVSIVRHIVDNENPGTVVIYKYDDYTDQFREWQTIIAMDPIDVKFVILSTNELVLYVVTNCPSTPLIIYEYNGIAGFKTNYVAAALPILTNIQSISSRDKDFIAVYDNREIRIMKALYKGVKYY